MSHRLTRMPSHPLAPPTGILPVARIVLYARIGPGEHECHWCHKPLAWSKRYAANSIVTDHLDWDPTNDAPENLVPSCRVCNGQRTRKAQGSLLIQPGEPTVKWGGKTTRAVERTCELCGTSFLTIPAEVQKGKGRFCSMSCARRAPHKPRS